ncbi:MAG TPA: hypothetical protein VHX52_11630 [Steroidobacteraceae bacterium]|jgi:hypothetical protein|nr:hypothetical protein [Steroidobacteraceae bacterium]
MKARAATSWAAIGSVLLLAAATARAQAVPTARLLQPSDLFQVSSSPSGSRLAGLTNDHGWVLLLVSQWQGDQLRPAVSTYYLRKYRSIIDYRWLTDDYLLVHVEDVVAGWQMPVVVGIPDNTWRSLPPFTQLIKYPWGDQYHALLQESSRDCEAARQLSFCLFSLNVNHWGGALISGPLQLLPVEFLAVSPGQIYASGGDIHGQHEEYHLDALQRWDRVPDGTVAQRRASLAKPQEPPASMMATAAHVGISHPTFVLTAPSGRLVGIIGHAPERAFVPLDPKLEGVGTWLASHYPTARVSISGLNDSLTRGQVTVWDADLPPTTFFLGPDGTLIQYRQASPRIESAQLGRTHMEPVWAPGDAVAVTMPPEGIALMGAVVMPVLTADSAVEDPLYAYRADVQAFAQQGIAVVQLLASIPDSFASNADGAAWRAAFSAHLHEVVDHASSELLHGEPVCLYGERLAGELALAAGDPGHVGCIAAVDAILNSSQFSRPQIEGLPVGFAGLQYRWVGPTQQMLSQEFPAVFGNERDQLVNSVSWVPRLPRRLMLGYDSARYADATRGYTAGDFAAGSASFRAAARKAGTQVIFYRPVTRFLITSQRQARMLDAVTHYVHDYYATVSITPATGAGAGAPAD